MYMLKAKKILTQRNEYGKRKKEKYASLIEKKDKKCAKARENYQHRKKDKKCKGKRKSSA